MMRTIKEVVTVFDKETNEQLAKGMRTIREAYSVTGIIRYKGRKLIAVLRYDDDPSDARWEAYA